MIIRSADLRDAEHIASIYNHYIAYTPITFETEEVSASEMKIRIQSKLAKYDWLVAEQNNILLGYAYYGEFRTRAAYRHTVESTVYVAQDHIGKGIGSKLYDRLCTVAKEKGFREMIGVIALPNPESVRLHVKSGFRESGVLLKIGYKFDRYIDVMFMQKSL